MKGYDIVRWERDLPRQSDRRHNVPMQDQGAKLKSIDGGELMMQHSRAAASQ
jgi:hypothetical protein